MAVKLSGQGVSDGIIMAKLSCLQKEILIVPGTIVTEPEKEIENFRRILDDIVVEIRTLYEHALVKLGEKDAAIFDAHLSILTDEYSVLLPIEESIRNNGYNAALAVEQHMDSLIEMFRQSGDELLMERSNDAADLKDWMLRGILGQEKENLANLREDIIVVADELTPSDTMRMDLSHVVGLATRVGGKTSHTAIIARNLGIPAVTGLQNLGGKVRDGQMAVLDGTHGKLLVELTKEDVAEYNRAADEWRHAQEALQALREQASVTADGVTLELSANIGSCSEVNAVITSGADGVGLFRSEFLFMGRRDIPSEEEQYLAYRSVLEKMEGKPVIVRTLDVGGDKDLPALHLPHEANPFLGYRAIRLCLDRTDIFMVQLRALWRASPFGTLKIMFPMISTMDELRQAKELLAAARRELENEGARVGKVEVGMMVEVPAAAVLAHQFAAEVDFFSIGTNDLIQYTLAAERGNDKVEYLYDHCNPAVLRLVDMTARAALEKGIMCGMCGESAGDVALIPIWLGLGLRELSMAPNLILRARRQIADLDTLKCRELARRVLGAADSAGVKTLLEEA